MGLGIGLPPIPPFPQHSVIPPFPGMPPNHAGYPFAAGFYGSGVPIPPPSISPVYAPPASNGHSINQQMPHIPAKPRFGVRVRPPGPTVVSSSQYLNRSFPSHATFSTASGPAAPVVYKCPHCFLVLDSAIAVASHMVHCRPAGESPEVARGSAGQREVQGQGKNCSQFFHSTIELGRHIADEAC